MGDDLGDHRIVPGADPVARPHARIGADAVGEAQMVEPADRGQEARGDVLGIEPCLEGMAAEGDVLLRERQGFARGHAQLPFHEIDARHGLGHRMLDLKPRVHLHEPEPVRAEAGRAVHDEFDRARPAVADGAGGPHRGLAHRGAHRGRHAGGRRLLDHLLVPALQRAVALVEMDRIGAVAEHLQLDMTRTVDPFLDQHRLVAEGGAGLGPGGGEGCGELLRPLDAAHPLAAPARHRLDEDRIADVLGHQGQMFGLLIRAVIARHDGHARLGHQRLGGILQAHGADRRGRGADEDEARGLDRLDELGVLGEEAVARMDGFRPGGEGRLDQPLAAQVAVGRLRAADRHRLVGHGHMERLGIGIGMDGDGRHAQAPGGGRDADGDLAAVGDQDLAEHRTSPSGPAAGGFPPPHPPRIFLPE